MMFISPKNPFTSKGTHKQGGSKEIKIGMYTHMHAFIFLFRKVFVNPKFDD